MEKHNCEECKHRANFDKNPKSFGGKLWRWHINWCPGWKGYMKSLSEDEKSQIKKKYELH